MILTKKARTISRLALAIFTATTLLSTTACHTIYDGTDCYQSYNNVHFIYDHNIKYADAFDHEVESVTLLVFDHESGKLVKRIDAPHASLSDDNCLVLDIAPGSYDLLTWAGDYAESFDIAKGEVGSSTLADFTCSTRRSNEADGAHIRTHLAGLYHNLQTVELPYASPSHPNTVTVPLTKNTNTFRIVLQQMSQNPGQAVLNADDFDVTITDDNGLTDYDNSTMPDEMLTYHPWHKYSGTVDINTNPQPAPDDISLAAPLDVVSRAQMGGMLAEITTGRLFKGKEPMLKITYTDPRTHTTKQVMEVKLFEFIALLKGIEHKDLDDQEYYDRQDEYNMTFFLDEGYRWMETTIIINDWRIIRRVGPIQ